MKLFVTLILLFSFELSAAPSLHHKYMAIQVTGQEADWNKLTISKVTLTKNKMNLILHIDKEDSSVGSTKELLFKDQYLLQFLSPIDARQFKDRLEQSAQPLKIVVHEKDLLGGLKQPSVFAWETTFAAEEEEIQRGLATLKAF